MRPRGFCHQVPRGVDYEISLQSIERTRRGANARFDLVDLQSTRCGNRAGSGLAGSCSHAVVGTAGSVAVEAGAIHQRMVIAKAARRGQLACYR